MASYQEIETRLAVVEQKLNFIMQNMRMKAVVSSGLSGPDGLPLPSRAFEGTLADLYRYSLSLPTLNQSEAEPPPIEK